MRIKDMNSKRLSQPNIDDIGILRRNTLIYLFVLIHCKSDYSLSLFKHQDCRDFYGNIMHNIRKILPRNMMLIYMMACELDVKLAYLSLSHFQIYHLAHEDRGFIEVLHKFPLISFIHVASYYCETLKCFLEYYTQSRMKVILR